MRQDDTPDREQRIQERAYAIWVEAGRPEGRDLEFWLMASDDLDEDEAAVTPLNDVGVDPAPLIPPNR